MTEHGEPRTIDISGRLGYKEKYMRVKQEKILSAEELISNKGTVAHISGSRDVYMI